MDNIEGRQRQRLRQRCEQQQKSMRRRGHPVNGGRNATATSRPPGSDDVAANVRLNAAALTFLDKLLEFVVLLEHLGLRASCVARPHDSARSDAGPKRHAIAISNGQIAFQ